MKQFDESVFDTSYNWRQMSSILLSIKPKWAEKIYSGEKTVEFRKTIPNCMQPGADGTVKALLYESAPVSRITGTCILSLDSFTPDGRFPDETLKKGCLSELEMQQYSKGRQVYALAVSEVKKWNEPVCRKAYVKCAPQSWCYLNVE